MKNDFDNFNFNKKFDFILNFKLLWRKQLKKLKWFEKTKPILVQASWCNTALKSFDFKDSMVCLNYKTLYLK